MSLYISLLRDKGAKDWGKKTALDGTVIGHNADLQVHHFFPRALLMKSGVDSAKINTFANYAIISKDTNIGISDGEPVNYVAKLKIKASSLDEQCIPPERALWSVTRYDDFLAARRELLAKRVNEYLG